MKTINVGKTIVSIALALSGAAMAAGTVQLVGTTQGKATLMINGGTPKTLKIGEKTDDGIKLIAADADGAELSLSGKRQRLKVGGTGFMGDTAFMANAVPATSVKNAPASVSSGQTVTLQADSGGHFWANITVNGLAVRGMVDTGATGVAFSSLQARSLGIDYLSGSKSTASTAGGYVPMYRVTLTEVRLGDIVLYNVPAAVLEGPFPESPLLGNSLLSRLNMDRKGDQLTLTKRF